MLSYTEKPHKKQAEWLTGCLNASLPAHHSPKRILGHALIVALISGAVRLGLLEVSDQERAIDEGGVMLILRYEQAVVPPLCGDWWDSIHLAVEHERLLLHSDDVTGLQREGQLCFAHHTWGRHTQSAYAAKSGVLVWNKFSARVS